MSRTQKIRNALLAGLIAIGLTSTAFARTSVFNTIKVYRNGSTTATATAMLLKGAEANVICTTYNCGGGRRS